MQGVIAIVMVFSIPLVAILGGLYVKVQKMKLEAGGENSADVQELKKQIGHLMAENDEIKERLKNMEYIMSDETRKIDFSYEEEQSKLDNNTNKFNL